VAVVADTPWGEFGMTICYDVRFPGLCRALAPAMCGQHPGNWATHGHSLIVDPWGRVLVEGGDVPGVFIADIDPAAVVKARAMIPSLAHDRAFRVVRGAG
jgi:predicted amidohydrolase